MLQTPANQPEYGSQPRQELRCWVLNAMSVLLLRLPLRRGCPTGHAFCTQSENGVVLVITLLILSLLLIVGVGVLMLSRTDLLISRNFLTSTQALWLARTGTEVGKNWLEANLAVTPLPVTVGPEELADGTYTVDIADLGGRAYRLTAHGLGPEGSRHVVEELVRMPDFSPAGVITSDGDGLHPDFNDQSGGIGRRIPDFTVDGRNHAPDGALSALCPGISPFATTQAVAQDDLIAATDLLKREIVTRANSFCQSDGSDASGPCTPGLFWVRGSGAFPYFTSGPCVATNPACFLNLSLADAALRATEFPPATHLPNPPENRGPFTSAPATPPVVHALSTTERARLHLALDDIARRVAELPEEKILRVTASLATGSHSYGTWAQPQVTQVENALEVGDGAVVTGAGILVIPHVVRLRNATVRWQGIVLVVGDGDLQVVDPTACGQILGAVVVRDDATPNRKLDLDLVQRSGGCPPLAVNYSCEAVTRALTVLMRTVSWIERFGA